MAKKKLHPGFQANINKMKAKKKKSSTKKTTRKKGKK